MNEDQSPIHSMNVSLGTQKAESSGAQAAAPRPWVVLFCSDLGFVSKKPDEISAATLNDFFSTYTVKVSGAIETGLPEDIPPFHLEYSLADIKDFTFSALAENLPLLNRLKEASGILDVIGRGRMPAKEGLLKVVAMDLPQGVLQQLRNCMPSGAAPAGIPSAPQKSAAVDSILSMMDVGDSPEPQSSPKSDDLATLLTTHGTEEVNTAALNTCRQSIDRLIATLGDMVARQPFFRRCHASWNSLKILLKAAGRNRALKMYLHSAPEDTARHHFEEALLSCTKQTGVPDIVVWDYPVTTDTASVTSFEEVGTVAERYKSVVCASIDITDALYAEIIDKKPLMQVLAQPAYIPLRRLQEKQASRCMALCAPQATAIRSGSSGPLPVDASWVLALQWMVSFLEYDAPFHMQNGSVMTLEALAFPKLPRETADDGHEVGITILRPDGVTIPRVLLGDTESPYGSMLFNMCVNRVVRLAAEWVSECSCSREEAATLLEVFLTNEFSRVGFDPADGAFVVNADGDRGLTVRVDAPVTIAGFKVVFDFSLGYQQ